VRVGEVPETVAARYFGRTADGEKQCTLHAMPAFDISFMHVDRDDDPTVVEGFFRTGDWPALPREGEGLDLAKGLDPQMVESVRYDLDGHPTVFVGRVVLDDLEAQLLRKAGRRVTPLPGGH